MPVTRPIDTRAVIAELLDVLLQCEAPRRLKLKALEAVDAARDALEVHQQPTARQGWDVCARQQSGRLIDDLMRANREASPLESLLLLPLLAQARQIHDQLAAIASAIDATPEN